MAKTYLYVGNWHDKKNNGFRAKEADGSQMDYGIALCSFDEETGEIKKLSTEYPEEFFGVGRCFIDKNRNVFYATDERENHPDVKFGGGGSRIIAFAIDPETGKLTKVNEQPSFGSKASFVTGDEEGKYILVTNHGARIDTTTTIQDAMGKYHVMVQHDESNVVLFPLREDGSVGEPSDIFRLSGTGPKHFQHGPHAHSINKAPGKDLFAVCDKGGDQLYVLRLDKDTGKLIPAEGTPSHRIPGSGCRYSSFHPTKPYLYINHEAESLLTAFVYDEEGRIREVETIVDQPEGYPEPSKDALFQSDVRVDPSGKYLYAAIRVTNVVLVYDIDQETGKLAWKQTFDTEGGIRMLEFSPDGRFLLGSFPYNNKVEVYPIAADGTLGRAVSTLTQPTPATLNFFRTE